MSDFDDGVMLIDDETNAGIEVDRCNHRRMHHQRSNLERCMEAGTGVRGSMVEETVTVADRSHRVLKESRNPARMMESSVVVVRRRMEETEVDWENRCRLKMAHLHWGNSHQSRRIVRNLDEERNLDRPGAYRRKDLHRMDS